MLENLNNKELHAERVKYGLQNIPVTNSNRSVLIKDLQNVMCELKGPTKELEQLTNKQLREEMLKWGLPNVPVTQSSRSLLIRRLRKAMQDELNNKNKHNTSTQYETAKVKPAVNTTKSPITKRRASLQKSEVENKTRLETQLSKNVSNSINISQETSRRSQTPLSKSGVLATSYVHEIRPLQREIVEMDIDDFEEVDSLELDEDAQSVDMEESPYTESYFKSSSTPLNSPPPILNHKMSYEPTSISSSSNILYNNHMQPTTISNSSNVLYNNRMQPTTIPNSSNVLYNNRIQPTVYSKPEYKVSLESPRVRFEENIEQKHTLLSNNNKLYPNLYGLKDINEQPVYNTIVDSETEQLSEIEVSSEDEPIVINSATSSEYSSPIKHYEHVSPNLQRRPYDNQNNTQRHSEFGSIKSRSAYNRLSRSPDKMNRTINKETSIINPLTLQSIEKRYHIKQCLAFIIAFLLVAFIYAFFF